MITNPKKAKNKRARRHARVRSRVMGTAIRPRLAIFRSNKHLYAQLIDDLSRQTLAAASDLDTKSNKDNNAGQAVGAAIAKLALAKKIKQVAFDRGGYLYTGRVKAVAEGARAGGLEF